MNDSELISSISLSGLQQKLSPLALKLVAFPRNWVWVCIWDHPEHWQFNSCVHTEAAQTTCTTEILFKSFKHIPQVEFARNTWELDPIPLLGYFQLKIFYDFQDILCHTCIRLPAHGDQIIITTPKAFVGFLAGWGGKHSQPPQEPPQFSSRTSSLALLPGDSTGVSDSLGGFLLDPLLSLFWESQPGWKEDGPKIPLLILHMEVLSFGHPIPEFFQTTLEHPALLEGAHGREWDWMMFKIFPTQTFPRSCDSHWHFNVLSHTNLQVPGLPAQKTPTIFPPWSFIGNKVLPRWGGFAYKKNGMQDGNRLKNQLS